MLNTLFGSASRAKILNSLLLHPDQEFLAASLAKDLELTANAVRHELALLLSTGLILETKRKPDKGAEKKYYRVATSFLLYPEIKALFTKAQILFSDKFVEELKRICQPKYLALTGLFTNYPDAQTDILLVGSVRRPLFLKLLSELEKEVGREINFTILSEAEFRYRQEVMDIFLYNILEGKTLVLIDNLSESDN